MTTLTRDEIMSLRGEDLNRAVLEQLGWKHISQHPLIMVSKDGDRINYRYSKRYDRDLFLVFTLEDSLLSDYYSIYIKNLGSVAYDEKSDAPMGWLIAHASAEQRCRAYLLTVNGVK